MSDSCVRTPSSAKQPHEQRVVARVVDEKARVEREPVVRDRVRVAAGALVALEDRHVVRTVRAGERRRARRCPLPTTAIRHRRSDPMRNRCSPRGEQWLSSSTLVLYHDWTKFRQSRDSIRLRSRTVRTGTSRISQVVTLVAVVVPPLGILSAMGLLWGVAFRWVDLAAVRRASTSSAPSARRSASTATSPTAASGPARPSRRCSAILGCMTMQGPLTQWVTDHRKHHALSDQARRPALAARRPRRRAPGAQSAASSTRTSAGCSRTSAWSRGASTARICTRTGWCGRSTASICVWVVLTFGLPFRGRLLRSAARWPPGRKGSSGAA